MPFPKRDHTGERFGRLVVVGDAPRRDNTKHRFVACQCDCGKTAVVRLGTLRSGQTKSCGCLHRETLAANHTAAEQSLVGRRYGRLVVVEKAPSKHVNGKWHGYWNCQCDCGHTTTVQRSALTSRATTSCGCFQQEQRRLKSKTHGLSNTPEYRVWAAMVQRCCNSNNVAFKDYGARGITVSEPWKTFRNFINDMGQRPAPGFSLDRIDVNRGYSKENCRWTTRDVQNKNRSFVSREEGEALKAEIVSLKAKLAMRG